ncbi:MAG: pseudouridine synthase [Saprospiraceae bacterium]
MFQILERLRSHSLAMEEMRLNKFLAHCGIASRRAADTLIMQGHVTVNGVVVQEMGHKVQDKDVVVFKGKTIRPIDKFVYFLLNKPRNILSTSQDERGRKTVLDILEGKINERVYPVGRLDRNTTGLLLLTNDGELTKKLSHPKYNVPKVYHVSLSKNLNLKDLELIRSGVTLEDGDVKADSLHYIEDMGKNEVQIEIHSGKNRVIRRIFEHLGYEVMKLDRTYYAGLTKKNLPRGRYRPLTKEEIRMLKHFV